jgi:hypothetical protein
LRIGNRALEDSDEVTRKNSNVEAQEIELIRYVEKLSYWTGGNIYHNFVKECLNLVFYAEREDKKTKIFVNIIEELGFVGLKSTSS